MPAQDEKPPEGAGLPSAPDVTGPKTGIIGHTLGGCRVVSKLGEGGMGAVFKAHDPGLDRMVAVKILPPSLARDASYRERFLREARALARVKHQNLVQVYSVAVEKGLHFFSMEYIEGESLMRRIRRGGPMLLEQMLAVAGQVLSALGAIHAQGITHRDVKSANIMIDARGRVVLMDLGLAKDESARGVTSAGVIIGTPEYMSPEQAMGENATPLSDIYAFGVVLYEMSSGALPFQGKSAVTVLRQQCEAEPPSLAKARPDLPAAFIEAVAAAMRKGPAARPQTAAALAKLLAAAGTTPELLALAASPAASGNPLSAAPTALDRDLHTAPTLAGTRPGEPTQVHAAPGGSGAALVRRRPWWRRPRVLVPAAILLVIAAATVVGRRNARRREAPPPAAAQPPAADATAWGSIFVGDEDFLGGRKARLAEGWITREYLEVILDDGTRRRIPLDAHPEIRYEVRATPR